MPFRQTLTITCFIFINSFFAAEVTAQSSTISNRSDPPIEGAKDAAEKLQLAQSLLDNREFVFSYSKVLAQAVPRCLWSSPFVGRITQGQRESAQTKAENVSDDELIAVVSKLPSFLRFQDKVRRELAFQNSTATLLKANELLENPEGTKFVLSWLGRYTSVLAPGCLLPAEHQQTVLAYEITQWALSK